MKVWESEKHQSWGMKVEGFRGHVATDGSLLGKTGNWGACGWAVVQLDYDEVELLVEVEHVKAHRTRKEKDKMLQFEKFVTEGN